MWTEFWTTSRICQHLQDMGCEIVVGRDLFSEGAMRYGMPSPEYMENAYNSALERGAEKELLENMRGGYTGVLAIFRTGKPGSKTTFRFDIDALPVEEANGEEHIPTREGFASMNNNMHACGHDGHIAIGLGLARRISKAVEEGELSGDIRVLFQPAEEGGVGGGALAMNPLVINANHFMSVHLGIYPVRRLICGMHFLSLQKYNITYNGRSTHAAAYPDEGRNALLAACNAVTQLYAIPRHKDGASRINVGEFHSNNALNIISPETKFKVEVRGETNTIQQYMDTQAKKILEGTANIHGCQCTIEDDGGTVASSNSPEMIDMARKAALARGVPEEALIDTYTVMGSEDATYIMEAVKRNGGKVLYMCLGSPTRGGHHNPLFDFDEDLLGVGVDVLWDMLKTL